MTDEVNCKLIDLVQSQSCIYDKTDIFYSNKDHVKIIWQEIADQMSLTVPVCQKRWRYLRDYFVRQLHMTQTDEKRSYWVLYDRMTFLKPFSTTRKIKSASDGDETNNSIRNKTKRIRKRNRSKFPTNHLTISNTLLASKSIHEPKSNSYTSGVLSISSGNSGDEFNSFDYLNLYNAQFGLADDAAFREQIHLQEVQAQQKLNSDLNIPLNSTEPQIVLEEEDDNSAINKINFNNNNDNDNTNTNNCDNNDPYNLQNLPILLEKSEFSVSHSDWPYHKYENSSNDDENDDMNSNRNIIDEQSSYQKHQNYHKCRNDLLKIFQTSQQKTDEHEHFFKSLLTNVRKIDEDLIMPFRSEIIQTIIKYQCMSQHNNNNESISNNNNNSSHIDNYDGQTSEIIIIDTGETDWRKKLKNRF